MKYWPDDLFVHEQVLPDPTHERTVFKVAFSVSPTVTPNSAQAQQEHSCDKDE